MGILSRARTVLRDGVLTAPSPFFSPRFGAPNPDEAEAAARQIGETAAYDAGALIPRGTCEAISAGMSQALAGKRPDIRVSINERTGIGHVHGALRLAPEVLDIGVHPRILAIVERCLRRRIYLPDVDMRRVPPMTMDELDQRAGTASVGYTSSHWHRDIRGRQVKVMVYLTDVGPQDSNFAYLPASHRGHHIRPAHVEESRLTEVEVAATGVTPVECYGPAGTTLIFDTNLLHRLRRKSGAAIRDSITFYYTPGQELRPLDLDAASAGRLSAEARKLFDGHRP